MFLATLSILFQLYSLNYDLCHIMFTFFLLLIKFCPGIRIVAGYNTCLVSCSFTKEKFFWRWMLPEVVKLVDGVTQYGVGRWSEIKKELFATSADRTSVDLKGVCFSCRTYFSWWEIHQLHVTYLVNSADKWRNLLRTSLFELRDRNKIRIVSSSFRSKIISNTVKCVCCWYVFNE